MKRNNPYKVFEITVEGPKGTERETVNRITFQEAVRDAYFIIAKSNHTKKIISIKSL